jgi:hypothetical protein
VNRWEAHFQLSIALRKKRWRALPRAVSLIREYKNCLRGPLSDEALAAAYAEAGRPGGGKHCGHQRVWNWNALALQEFRFRVDQARARACLRAAWALVPGLISGRAYGRETDCVEATWLFLLLNDARIDVRSGAGMAARTKLGALLRFCERDGSGLVEAFPDYPYSPGQYRFSWDPELVSFLREKAQEELAYL